MPLMRPTGLGSGIDKDRPDYTVFTGECEVGRIYQTRGGPDSLRWFWSLTVNGPMTRSDRVATLEEAKAQFQKSWDAWKAWAKLEESHGAGAWLNCPACVLLLVQYFLNQSLLFRACVRIWLIKSLSPKCCTDATTPSRPMPLAVKG